MIVVTGASVNEVFARACGMVLDRGASVAPRGLETREVMGAYLRLTDPRRRLLDLPPVRILNPAFAVAETVWILSGSDDPWIYDFNDSLRQFADDGILQGAYGPRMRRWRASSWPSSPPATGVSGRGVMGGERARAGLVVDQLDSVRSLLVADPDSRRAVIQLFDPSRDFLGHRDIPCTLGYRFYLRQGKLDMYTTMRSQDLWLGFGYDVFAATVLQEFLAGWLGVELGEYHHHVDSLHLYAPVLERAAAIQVDPPSGEIVEVPAIAWDDFDHALRGLASSQPGGGIGEVPATGAWPEAAIVLDSYRRWKAGDRAGARHRLDARSGVIAQALKRWYRHLDEHLSHPLGSSDPPSAEVIS